MLVLRDGVLVHIRKKSVDVATKITSKPVKVMEGFIPNDFQSLGLKVEPNKSSRL
jgi:hypothetical protein